MSYQTQEKTSFFATQNSGTSSFFGNKNQEITKSGSSDETNGLKLSENSYQKPSLFGY